MKARNNKGKRRGLVKADEMETKDYPVQKGKDLKSNRTEEGSFSLDLPRLDVMAISLATGGRLTPLSRL